MKRVCVLMFGLAVSIAASPAWAQQPASPSVDSWYVGANTGAAIAEKSSGVFGLEAGARVWKNLDVVGELVWAQNVVTSSGLDAIGTIATHLQQTTGSAASGSVKVPLFASGVGARWVFEYDGLVRPYAIVVIGGAKTERKPTLTLAGADITGSAATYGITLGNDVIGESNDFASEFGGGVLINYNAWYIDGGVRILTVTTPGDQTNVARIVVGGGYRF